jgi:hypothetical protein
MNARVKTYVIGFGIATALVALLVYWQAPEVSLRVVAPVLVLSVLIASAQMLVHNVPGGVMGTISFIPILATVVLAPSWIAVLGIFLSSVATVPLRRQVPIKGLFNAAQFAMAGAITILTYRALGGATGILGSPDTQFPQWTQFAQILLLSLVFMLVNGMSVAGAMALSESRPFVPLWWSIARRTIIYDLLASPAVYVLVWLYATRGVWGAVWFAAPLFMIRQLYKSNGELERINQELLELMVKAIEARDPYTSGHSRRVSQYSKIIGRAIGLGGSDLDRVGIVALLHDVGKIHEIYAPILRKPEKLSPGEWAVMQTHPIKSAELVSTVSRLRDVVLPIRHHHENWDGTGYPDGLAGDQIPLEARIVLFADTIDAMTTDRPYRKALTESQVRTELVRYRGKQFDPEICDRLLASPMFGLLFAPHQRESTPESSASVSRRHSERLPASV